MNAQFIADMERFTLLTFTRQKLCAPLLEQIHRLLLVPLDDEKRKQLNIVRRWLLSPYSLWPVDMKGLGEVMCRQLCEVKSIDEDLAAVLNRLENLPSEETQTLIIANERGVKDGNYASFITPGAQDKYDGREKETLANEELKAEIAALQRRFDLEKYYLPGRVLRRTLTGERNIRPESFENVMDTERKRFEAALDSICAKYHLYGLLETKPLLLKLSVNATAHGLMIFIPAYWSFDYRRDLNWPAIMKLQKARSLRAIEIEYISKLTRFAAVEKEADLLGLTGDARHDFLCEKMGIPTASDESLLRRWSKHARTRLHDGGEVNEENERPVPRRRRRSPKQP